MVQYTYKHGLPFSEILGVNLNDLRERVINKKASLIIIDGFIGEGKTTLAVQVADYLNGLDGFPPIKFDEQLSMGGDQFQQKLRICFSKGYHCIIYDEAGDFSKRGAMTKFNFTLNRTFETFRAFRIIPILCLPSFEVLDNSLFYKGIPRLLLNLSRRNNHQGNFEGYSYNRMMYIKKKMEKLVIKPQAYSMTQGNFYGHFLNLPPERSKELDLFSTRGKLEILQRNEIESRGLLDYAMIGQRLNMTPRSARNYVVQSKIKAVTVIKKKKYFSMNEFKQLQGIVEGARKRQIH
jgi:hypothetical protein